MRIAHAGSGVVVILREQETVDEAGNTQHWLISKIPMRDSETGEVTHVNIPAGRENRSVMYVTPKTLQRLMLGRTVTNNAVQNTAVQLIQQGALKDEISAQRAAPQWYATLPQVGGVGPE